MLKALVEKQINASGLSKDECVRRLGFDNIDLGLQTLDQLIEQGSSDRNLLNRLARVLNVDHEVVIRANRVTMLTRSNTSQKQVRAFRPWIEIKVANYSGPKSYWMLNASQWRVLLPRLITQPGKHNEIAVVKEIYQMHITRLNGQCMGSEPVGFVYHRTASQSLEFDGDGKLLSMAGAGEAKESPVKRPVRRQLALV